MEEEQKVDNWARVVFEGKQVVIKRYYKQQGRNSTSYVLCDGGPTLIYSNLIFVTKFTMQLASHCQKDGRRGGS
jgi:hypothetical protein